MLRAHPTTTAVIGLPLQQLDFPTWLPAMLVKELRQGLRARGFVGALVGFQVIMTLFTIFAIAGGTGSESFEILQGAYWVVLNVQLLVITPARGLFGLQAELDSRAIDLLLLTRLTAWRIVLGKWISLLVQSALLVVAVLPYGVARYFFGSVDLAGEAKLIAFLFAGSSVLTALALWSSAWPKIARVALGFGMLGVWQFIPGSSFTSLVTGGSGRSGGAVRAAISVVGAEAWLVFLNAALVLALCLVGAVRRMAPRAENQSGLMRVLPLLAFAPVPFLGLRLAGIQIVTGGILFALVAALELARPEEPMASHWRAWVRFGWSGRLLGRLVQPGWASAMEWVLVLAVMAAAGGLVSPEPQKVALLALLGTEALVFPALLLTWMSAQFTQRAAGYVLVLGGASLIAAVGTASASMMHVNKLADLTLLLLPISSFWATLAASSPPANALLVVQIAIASAVLGLAWWRARPYRVQRREFAAAGGPAVGSEP